MNPNRITAGSAVVVVALLAFAVGWVVLMTYDVDPNDLERLGDWEALVLVLVVGAPPVWAARLVSRIIEHATPEEPGGPAARGGA